MENVLLELPNIGRFLIGFYFAFFGFWNIYHWRPSLNVLLQKNFPLPFVVLPTGIFWQIAAGTMIIFNSYIKLAAMALIIFIIVGCYLFHDFWNMKGEARKTHMTFFITNFTIGLGTLLLLLNNITPYTTFSDLTL